MTPEDRELGLDRAITRRDFIDGIAAAIGAGLGAPRWADQAPGRTPYPPAVTGLRGAHRGAFEALHAIRDARFWRTAPNPVPTGERFDLVVVGAGISGLTAAYRYRQARPGARVLLLDNHDDFGGHAKRNEFTVGGKTIIGYGGTQSIDSPAPYSPAAKSLIAELGIDVARYPAVERREVYRGLRSALFFDRETFGRDAIVPGSVEEIDAAFIREAPVPPAAKADLTRLVTERFDPFAELEPVAKRRRLARTSYADFLFVHWKLDPLLRPIFETSCHDLFGLGIDAVPAQDAYGLDLPGFQGMGLAPGPGPGQNYDAIRSPEAAGYYFHFPDGNATIARLLVGRLIPGAVPGRTADEVVTARADYGALDRAGSPVRLRLRSPVLRVRHTGSTGAATGVEITYAEGPRLRTVTAGAVVLACWHTVIPYICGELPAAQRKAMAFETKVPLVYTNVLIRDWTAFSRLGIRRVVSPSFWHTAFGLDFPVSIGSYRCAGAPSEPVVVHMSKALCRPGLAAQAQHKAGRLELYRTPFATIERSIRSQLNRVLGPGGFAAARDVLAVTVNRWPHGYAYQYNSLFDDFWIEGGELPCAVARKPFGRITIANADAGAYSYTDAAIDHGLRAADEAARLT